MLRTRGTDLIKSSLTLVTILAAFFHGLESINSRFEDDKEEREDLIIEYKPSGVESPAVNYDFDFESAVISGIPPALTAVRGRGNETSSNSEPGSSPGCPEPFEGRPWILYGKPPKCYLSGYQWPCPENMKLMPQRSSSSGYCDCNCSSDSYNGQTVTSPQSYCLGHTSDGKERILVYMKKWKACFPLFEQGRCPVGKWLVLLTESPLRGPFCKTRKCPVAAPENPGNSSTLDTFSFYDFRTEACHNVGDRCNSSNLHLPAQEAIYELTDGDWIPTCNLGLNLRALSHRIGFSETDCGRGQRLSRILGSCVPSASADRTFGIG